MAASSMLHVRLDDETKTQGAAVLDAIGLSASDAVRLLYHRLIADHAFPLELKVANAETRAAMAEAHEMLRARNARFTNVDDLIATVEAARGK
ncbi:MAG: type II toxin-antitoxin system RelB/DinJ family antitoxin [Sphingomicrobium sp.]|nr:type II toxin-antitoxin system RelB/DinJ family antitoxin [Sphingomonadales bacterium]